MENYIDLFNEIYNKFMEKYYKSNTFKEYFSNLSYRDIQYLEVIHKYKNITISELAYNLEITKSAVTQNINKLIKNGYVNKTQSESDKRNYNLTLTENVNEYFFKNDKVLNELYNDSLSGISSNEKKQLLKILEKINKSI